MISVRGLSKKYDDKFAVHDVNLEVKSGEIFGFLGPNGAGKTTTINMLIGMLTPTSGEIEICGVNVLKDPKGAKALIGYVPDQPNVYEKLTAWEFLMFVAKIYNTPEDAAKAKAFELLEMFGIADRANDLIGSFSHGMKQKVVMASALVHNPKVVFMDEPTVGLDPKSARLVKDILRELADSGVTVFLTTHILDIAEKMCDRIGIILKGQLLAQGSMEELRRLSSHETNDLSLEDLFLELTNSNDQSDMEE